MYFEYFSRLVSSNLIVLILLILPVSIEYKAENMSGKLLSVDFEVFGVVQGVFFRKYTQKEAQNLGLKGYCKNTMQDTVVGTIQGEINNINRMKNWLQNTGSPSSRIDKAEFRNEKEIKECTFNDFSIRG